MLVIIDFFLRSLLQLAIQVTNELTRVSSNHVPIGTIVGGFAEVKQRRVLEKKRPPVLVCTPGRLWELVSQPYVPPLL
jgi:superfamily II DNA/RNA helicase